MEHKYKSAKTFTGILYADNDKHIESYNKLRRLDNIVFIWHDKDINNDGSIKKKHLHFIIKFPVRRTILQVSILLDVEYNLIQTCSNETVMLRYLLHLDDKDKAQYDYDDVEGNGGLYKRFCLVTNEDTENDRVLKLIGLLEGYEQKLTLTEFVKIVCEVGLYPEMRRAGYLFTIILKEHNDCIR